LLLVERSHKPNEPIICIGKPGEELFIVTQAAWW